MIFITGDMHGDKERLFAVTKDLKADDFLIVCGDFGFIFRDDAAEEKTLNDIENKISATILFCDGNHENFDKLFKYPTKEWHGGKIHRIRKNIVHLMRGYIFSLEDHTFFVFGGAASIDKYMRREHVSWWPDELPNDDEYKRAIATLKENNFKADYIITHEAPKEVALKELFFQTGDRYGALHPDGMELQGFLEWIMIDCTYNEWFCGHWHDDREFNYEKLRILWHDVVKIDGEQNEEKN